MKIIILEGIATSGKTTIQRKLVEELKRKYIDCLLVGEDETFMPILHNTELEVSKELLLNVLRNTLSQSKDLVIFDRLYFTHVFRTNSKLSDFNEIEDELLKKETLLILLLIDEHKIQERVFGAMEHRDKKWEEFVRKKGTNEEIIQYYQDQQKQLIKLTKQAKLQSLTFDTSEMGFDEIIDNIMDVIQS